MKFFDDLRSSDFKAMSIRNKCLHIFEYYKVLLCIIVFTIVVSVVLIIEHFSTSDDDLYFLTFPNTGLNTIHISTMIDGFNEATGDKYSVSTNFFSPTTIKFGSDDKAPAVGADTPNELITKGNCDVFFLLKEDAAKYACTSLSTYMSEAAITKYSKATQNIFSGNSIIAININDTDFFDDYLYDCEAELYLCISSNVPVSHKAALRDFIDFVLE